MPIEAYAPLAIYTDAELTGSFTFQLFEPVVGRNSNIFECLRIVQHPQLSIGNLLNILRQFP